MSGKLWVTGARGFLGRHVARRFARAGWSVAGIGRGTWDIEDARRWGVDFWSQHDVTSEALARLGAINGPPDVLIHAAGGSSVGRSLADPRADFYATVASTDEVISYLQAKAPVCRLVLTSSAAVYGVRDAEPIKETAAIKPVSPYGLHKSLAEQLCSTPNALYQGPSLILRLFSLYGPELRKQLLWDIAHKLSLNPEIVNLRGTGDETRDMLHVADAADFAFAAVMAECGGVLNMGCGEAMTVRDIASATAAAFGCHPRLVFDGATTPADPPHQCADVTRLSRLGCVPRIAFTEGAADYAAWFRSLPS